MSKLSDLITRDIFEHGGGKGVITRIQFKSGKYPDKEISRGGLCLSALSNVIDESLAKHLEIHKKPAQPMNRVYSGK